jgi:curved DNA-binding protein
VLSDPEKRERYGRLGGNWRQGDDVSGAPGFDGFRRAGDSDGIRFEFRDAGFSDFFESAFGPPSETAGSGSAAPTTRR